MKRTEETTKVQGMRARKPTTPPHTHTPKVVARHAAVALFEGALGAALDDASRALFAPDVASEHIEYAKHVLVGGLGGGWVCLGG